MIKRTKNSEAMILGIVNSCRGDPKRLFTQDDKHRLLSEKIPDEKGLYECEDCHQHFRAEELTVDHKRPWSLGGRTELSNAQLLCRACNSRKSNKSKLEINMKQTLLLMVLAFGMCSINIKAQEKSYKVEDDGFEWYDLYEYKNGDNYDGAQDKFGNSIIPQQKDISVIYSNGFFLLRNRNTLLQGVIDKQGNLIVPVEYNSATPLSGDNYPIPYISVEKDGYEGVYDIYGKCIIPVNRRYKDISQLHGENGERCVYYRCSDGKWDTKRMNKYTICDASGKVVFTTSKSYQSLYLIRDKASGKCALIVEENDRWYFINKEEKVLWNPNNIVNFDYWPIKIKTSLNGSWRRLNQAELNKILLSEDILKGNKEYFAHASEYPKQKIGKIGENNIMTETKVETTPTQQPEKDQKIIIEHPRDPIPVQEWQQCTNCGGAGKLGCERCGGSGTIYIGNNLNICHSCNGHGEKRCTFCAGRGGQYITVYR